MNPQRKPGNRPDMVYAFYAALMLLFPCTNLLAQNGQPNLVQIKKNFLAKYPNSTLCLKESDGKEIKFRALKIKDFFEEVLS